MDTNGTNMITTGHWTFNANQFATLNKVLKKFCNSLLHSQGTYHRHPRTVVPCQFRHHHRQLSMCAASVRRVSSGQVGPCPRHRRTWPGTCHCVPNDAATDVIYDQATLQDRSPVTWAVCRTCSTIPFPGTGGHSVSFGEINLEIVDSAIKWVTF